MARIFREAGAEVRYNAYLRDIGRMSVKWGTVPPSSTAEYAKSDDGMVANIENSPAIDTRHGGGTGICQGVGNLSDEDGSVGSQVCNQMRRFCVLGNVGRRPPHDS